MQRGRGGHIPLTEEGDSCAQMQREIWEAPFPHTGVVKHHTLGT